MKLIWTIGGSDPSGAAGCQRDLITATDHRVHACSVLTAATAQNFTNWSCPNVLDHRVIDSQLASLVSSSMPEPQAIKIGMLGSPHIVTVVANYVSKMKCFVILDPLVKSTSGGSLSNNDTIQAIIKYLLPRIDLLTPNFDEAVQLTGLTANRLEQLPALADALLKLGARRVLIKGGHLNSSLCHDYYADRTTSYWLTTERHPTSARGTGCALATAIAVNIAKGLELDDALVAARSYVSSKIRLATSTETGAMLLGLGDQNIETDDFPSRTSNLPSQTNKICFPSCGSEPLGFYPVVDRFSWVKRLTDLGAKTMQIRIKDLVEQELIKELKQSIAYCRKSDVRLFINDHWKLAIELDAYGVHLGQEDLVTADLEAISRSKLRLGLSTHSLSEAAVAKGLNPSYVALGPIFPTTCKSLRFGPHGLAKIKTWRQMFSQPLVAIGGLKAEHAAEAMRFGASGVAVISDVTKNINPEERALKWLETCGQSTRVQI